MDIELIRATINHLYAGDQGAHGIELADSVEFHDPVVVIRGQRRVMRMFRRLNWLFPKSSVVRFEPIPDSLNQFSLWVHYARSTQATPTVFESTMDLHIQNGQITRIVEHWIRPLKRRGDNPKSMSRLIRTSLGRILA